MSVKYLTWAFEMDLEPNLKLVLLALADRSNDDGESFYGQSTIAKKCSMGERTVRRHLATLEQMHLLTRSARMRSDGRGRTSDLHKLHIDQPANLASRSVDQPANTPRPTGQSEHDQPATVGQGYVRETTEIDPRSSQKFEGPTEFGLATLREIKQRRMGGRPVEDVA